METTHTFHLGSYKFNTSHQLWAINKMGSCTMDMTPIMNLTSSRLNPSQKPLGLSVEGPY